MLVTVLSYVVLRRWLSPMVIAVVSLILAWCWMRWFPSQQVRLFSAWTFYRCRCASTRWAPC